MGQLEDLLDGGPFRIDGHDGDTAGGKIFVGTHAGERVMVGDVNAVKSRAHKAAVVADSEQTLGWRRIGVKQAVLRPPVIPRVNLGYGHENKYPPGIENAIVNVAADGVGVP